MTGRLIEVDVSDLGRAMLAEDLFRREGATAQAGAPTSVPNGLHVLAVTTEEVRAGLELMRRDPSTTVVDLRTLVPVERVALHKAGRCLLALHASDLTVPNGYLPLWDAASINFGQVIAVTAGHAVAHLLMYDSRVGPGDPVAPDYVPVFDTVSNVWVAHRHRRSGIAKALIQHARAAYPLIELQRPFTPEGAAWAAACTPDLVDVGRNSRCPCGSGTKFKRCCGARRAA